MLVTTPIVVCFWYRTFCSQFQVESSGFIDISTMCSGTVPLHTKTSVLHVTDNQHRNLHFSLATGGYQGPITGLYAQLTDDFFF